MLAHSTEALIRLADQVAGVPPSAAAARRSSRSARSTSAIHPLMPSRRAVLVVRNVGSPSDRVLDGLLCSSEWLVSFHLHLLQLHGTLHATPPRAVRTLLEKALGTCLRASTRSQRHGEPASLTVCVRVGLSCTSAVVFPASRVFLSTYSRAGTQSQLSIRARRFLSALERLRECPAHVWTYTLCAELMRAQHRFEQGATPGGDGDGSARVSVHRVRRMFEAAVTDTAAASVVLLWRWYLRFELACGSPTRAKRVYLRAVAR